MKLKGQVAVITGAGRNIGKAMAKLFASEGAKIAVAEVHEGRGQAVVDELNRAGHEAMLVLGDVSKSDDVQAMVKKVVARFGAIDILVNNAGEQHPDKDIRDITEEQLRRTFQTNIFGMFFMTQAAAAHLKHHRQQVYFQPVGVVRSFPLDDPF